MGCGAKIALMAANPERDPIQEEAERILRENPELRARLEAYNRDLPEGKVKLVEHAEVRRRLRELGVPLDED